MEESEDRTVPIELVGPILNDDHVSLVLIMRKQT